MSPRKKTALIFTAAGVVLAGAAIALVILLFMHAGKPSEAACKAAMKADYSRALSDPSAPAATEPSACKGIPAPELSKLAGSIPSAAPSVSLPSGNVTACRDLADQRRKIAAMQDITPADAEQVAQWFSDDQLEATGQLSDDFGNLYDTFTTSEGNSDIAMSAVQDDCTQLGIRT
jgi:hypothetical protein